MSEHYYYNTGLLITTEKVLFIYTRIMERKHLNFINWVVAFREEYN